MLHARARSLQNHVPFVVQLVPASSPRRRLRCRPHDSVTPSARAVPPSRIGVRTPVLTEYVVKFHSASSPVLLNDFSVPRRRSSSTSKRQHSTSPLGSYVIVAGSRHVDCEDSHRLVIGDCLFCVATDAFQFLNVSVLIKWCSDRPFVIRVSYYNFERGTNGQTMATAVSDQENTENVTFVYLVIHRFRHPRL